MENYVVELRGEESWRFSGKTLFMTQTCELYTLLRQRSLKMIPCQAERPYIQEIYGSTPRDGGGINRIYLRPTTSRHHGELSISIVDNTSLSTNDMAANNRWAALIEKLHIILYYYYSIIPDAGMWRNINVTLAFFNFPFLVLFLVS